jgi:hypothetical protein
MTGFFIGESKQAALEHAESWGALGLRWRFALHRPQLAAEGQSPTAASADFGRSAPVATPPTLHALRVIVGAGLLDNKWHSWRWQPADMHPKLVPILSCPWSDPGPISWGSVDRIFLNLTIPSRQ